MDPHTAATLTLDKIWAMCDEMIEAHQKDECMGEFSPTIKNTGRPFAGTGDRAIARLKAGEVFSIEAGANNELQLVVENPAKQPLAGRVNIQSSFSSVTIEGVDVSVEAEITQSYPIAVHLIQVVDQPIDFVLETSETILSRGVSLSPRTVLERDESRRSKVQLELGVELAASGTISRNEDQLLVDITVNDSNIQPAQALLSLVFGLSVLTRKNG